VSAADVSCDVVIVGSGIAGALAACRLADKGVRNIVMLEAGPRIERAKVVENFRRPPFIDGVIGFPNPPWAPRPDWHGGSAPYLELSGAGAFKLEYLRIVGGTTWHWGGCTPRLQPADFRLHSKHGVGKDWPIDYAALEPYYTAAEYELGVAGEDDHGSWRSRPFPLPPVPLGYCETVLRDGLKSIGIHSSSRPAARATRPFNGRGQCVGFSTCSPICPSGAQYGAIYHVEAAEKKGVRLLENTRADRVHTHGGAAEIEARRSDGTPVRVRAKIAVLAANAIETPRLLLMSAGESAPAGIANSSGQVGRNFMEHPTVAGRLMMPKPVYPGRGPVSTLVSPDFRDGPARGERPGFQISVENHTDFNSIALDLLKEGLEPPALDAAMKDQVTRRTEIHFNHEQLPSAENRITLDWGKRDSAGQPVMRLSNTFSDYEKKGFAFAADFIHRMAGAFGAQVLEVSEPMPDNHHMGTTCMGNDPKTSVTDSFGRCHDARNLFICGASLFPTAGSVNPSLTNAALTLRTADEIARQLSGAARQLQ
jgi:choline dehydrogenase-like flavoprotein